MGLAQRRPVDVGAFTLSGGPYTIRASDVEAYQAPFETEAGREALHAMMDACDFKRLLEEISDGFCSWQTDYPELVVELVDKVNRGEELNETAKGKKRVGD